MIDQVQSGEGRGRRKRLENGGREQILESARYFFAQKGFHQTGIDELAERAGVSVGQIYRQFAGKSAMIIAVVREDSARRLTVLEQINASVGDGTLTVRDGLEQVVKESMNEGGDPLVFEILAEAFRNEMAAEVIAEVTGRYRAILRSLALHANSDLTGDRLAAAEEILLASLFGLGNRLLTGPTLSLDQAARLASEFLYVALH
ncbi:TetR/AcrR family transcriptional regulator [Sphingomonas oryzagri]